MQGLALKKEDEEQRQDRGKSEAIEGTLHRGEQTRRRQDHAADHENDEQLVRQ